MFVEGQYRDTQPAEDFFELRMDGPKITEVSNNYYKLAVQINALVQSRMNDTNTHRIHVDVGIVAKIFTGINLYKYGTGDDDTQEHFGCLRLLQSTQTRDGTEINHFGQIDPKVRLMQATVEGHFSCGLSD